MKTVVGLMDTYGLATDSVRDLQNNGFNRKSISLLAASSFAGEMREGQGKQAPGGFALGLKRIDISGIGSVIAAGPIISLLPDSGIVGALEQKGVPSEHANYYAEGMRRGGTLCIIETDDDNAGRAADILSDHGAIDIEERSNQWKKTGWKIFDEKAAAYTSEQREREAVLPVMEEDVKIGKREVPKGRVRVHSYVIEKPVEEKVSLREEHAKVERRPVDRPVKAGEEAFRETTFEIEESAEEPVVSKEARVKEEVVVGKEASERKETISETARRTDVDVDQEADFQSHFQSNYASLGHSYDMYGSAYRYGTSLSQDKRYLNKDWPQIENNARIDWEKTNPGTWDRMKGAIRYGFDRMRGKPSRKAA